MKKHLLFPILSLVLVASALFGIESGEIIKVNAGYAIISQGVNQGIEDGQVFFVKRQTPTGLKDIAQVKVIRTTANRAAVEQISPKSKGVIEKGDRLFTEQNSSAASTTSEKPEVSSSARGQQKTSPQAPKKTSATPASTNPGKGKIEPITEPVIKNPDVPVSSPPRMASRRSYDLKKPWIGFNIGTIFPTGGLSDVYSPSINFGASYMVAAGNNFNLGVEINKSFLGNGLLGSQVLEGGSVNSSSILEALVVFQKGFGDHFFLEAGGGIFRPQIQVMSIDNVQSSFSSSNFGVFGGTGFFVPTSQYAGFTLRGRLHNYFDQTSRQYFGLAGGFRFKIH